MPEPCIPLGLMARHALGSWRKFLERDDDITALVDRYDPRPTALGIKVADESTLIDAQQTYFSFGDMVFTAPVNDRSISTIRKQRPFGGCATLRYVKLLQRRPGASDKLGLEHLDLTVPPASDLEVIALRLVARHIPCEWQQNGSHGWLSIRYEGFEFKIVDHSVWRVCCVEAEAMLKQDLLDM